MEGKGGLFEKLLKLCALSGSFANKQPCDFGNVHPIRGQEPPGPNFTVPGLKITLRSAIYVFQGPHI
jgi:hypothetical protein